MNPHRREAEQPVSKEEFYVALKAQADTIRILSGKIDILATKVDSMYEVFIEARYTVKLIKWVGITATATLVLWGLIKANFK